MNDDYDLAISGRDHRRLADHLLADGKEAAAILICRDLFPARRKLMVHSMILVPYEECRSREPDWITWPGERLSQAIDVAEDEGFSLVLIHSHPGGFPFFSEQDDRSDAQTIPHIFGGWGGIEPKAGHGSAIMMPEGVIRGRLYSRDTPQPRSLGKVVVVGDDIHVYRDSDPYGIPMAFGSDMTKALGDMHVCIVGVSGTGSIISEQAARMGFGSLTLIDFDRIEHKNLNRILGSSLDDALASAIKVDVMSRAIRQYRPDADLHPVPSTVFSRDAVLAAARCDIIFSCVDSAEGRQICDLMAQAFMVPLIDMGVTIPTRKVPGGRLAVADVLGRIDYIQPHGATLADREVFTPATLRAEYLAKVDPTAYEQEIKEGYIRGAPNEAPSVIALNMRAASTAMLELIARLFPYRHEPNRHYARILFALGEAEEEHFAEDFFNRSGAQVALGLSEPLLGLPDLGN